MDVTPILFDPYKQGIENEFNTKGSTMYRFVQGRIPACLAVLGLIAITSAAPGQEAKPEAAVYRSLKDLRPTAPNAVLYPSDTKFLVALDMKALRGTRIGGELIGLIKQKIQEELANESKDGKSVNLDTINEIVGFDPFNEIQRIFLFGADYDRPERSLAAIIDMKETTGNLEGFLLALPGYRDEEVKGVRVHSAAPDGTTRFYATVTDHFGGKRVALAVDRSTLDFLSGRPTDGQGLAGYHLDALLEVFVRAFPFDKMGEGPHTNVARIVERLLLMVNESDKNLEVTMSLTAAKPEQAEQLRQMTQGLMAALKLAQAMEPDDKDLQNVMAIIQDSKAAQEGNDTKVTFRLSSDKILELIAKELD